MSSTADEHTAVYTPENVYNRQYVCFYRWILQVLFTTLSVVYNILDGP